MANPVASYLERLHARHAGTSDGDVATYIPELADADPSWFGIALVTVDGARYEVGDTRQAFTIQSISKPLTFGLVLDDCGPDEVRRRIGVEPTGEAFNAITLDPVTGTPMNPMVNAGAIVAASMATQDRILDMFSGYAGRSLEIDEAVYRSEDETGHRNRAIAHLLRGSGALASEPEQALATYFRQCSVLVDCRDLAVIAATLANGGRNPITGASVSTPTTVRHVLTVMASCGMYDGAGEWLYTVGLPAKSGVSGGIIAVLPGEVGLAVFSPLLDGKGNSVRGVRVCQDLARELDLRLVQPGRRAAPPIRSAYSLAEITSKRQRSAADRARLAEQGGRVLVLELQGDIAFSAAELVTRRLAEADIDVAVLDFRRVDEIAGAVVPLLTELADEGRQLVVSGGPELGRWFPELDRALEWCEDQLLGGADDEPAVPFADHDLVAGLSDDDLRRLEAVLEERHYPAGSLVLGRGDPADEVLLILRGRLSVVLDLPVPRRLATLSGGMLLGEMAFLNREPRTSNVWADTDVTAYVLPASALAQLRDPHLQVALLGNLVRILSHRADAIRNELARLAE